MIDGGWGAVGKAQLIVGGAIPGLVILGSIRKQAEQAMGSKPVSSTFPGKNSRFLLCLSSCPDFI